MTNVERSRAILRFEQPDYYPIFGFPGAPGFSDGCMEPTRLRLCEQGMPGWVGKPRDGEKDRDSWRRYWGTTGPVYPDFSLALPAKEISCERRIEGAYEILEYETGARTRQLLDNDNQYSMPEFQRYHFYDRKGWERYRDLMTPSGMRSTEELEAYCKSFDTGDELVAVSSGGTWGSIRSLMGTEAASVILYDDPDLVREIMKYKIWYFETFTVPLIERVRPDILQVGEDNCYNHGMLISPEHFRRFCSPFYRRVREIADDCGVDLVALDTDGNAMELVSLLAECGVNGLFPFEVKAGNDLFALRRRHPRFVMFGWLEKECVNEGNEAMIEGEILTKVPSLLKMGGYFPNGDHGIQPPITFDNLRRFMTLLHEVTGNPEGKFEQLYD